MGLFIEKKDGLNPFLHKDCKEIIVKGSVFFFSIQKNNMSVSLCAVNLRANSPSNNCDNICLSAPHRFRECIFYYA